jgi:hypothetical protein
VTLQFKLEEAVIRERRKRVESCLMGGGFAPAERGRRDQALSRAVFRRCKLPDEKLLELQ